MMGRRHCEVCVRASFDHPPGPWICPTCGAAWGESPPGCHDPQVEADTDERDPPWITTFTGRRLNPIALAASEVCLADIAHALAAKCRWTGHTREFYPVAAHAIQVSEEVERTHGPALALAALHHDSAEAYLPDIASPIKARVFIQAGSGTARPFSDVERDALREIFEALGVRWPDRHGWQAIHAADKRSLVTEAHDLMHGTTGWWWSAPERLPASIDPGSAVGARKAFIDTHRRLRAEWVGAEPRSRALHGAHQTATGVGDAGASRQTASQEVSDA